MSDDEKSNEYLLELLQRGVELEKVLLQQEQQNIKQREQSLMVMEARGLTAAERALVDEAMSIRRKRYALILSEVQRIIEDL